MQYSLPLEEEGYESCLAITHFLEVYEDDQIIRETVLKDLCWRVSNLNQFDRYIVLAQAFQKLLPSSLKEEFPKEILDCDKAIELARNEKEFKDVGIVAVIGVELNAVLRALGIDNEKGADQQYGGYSYWFAELERPNHKPLKVVVTLVAEPLNVPCAIAVGHLLSYFNVDLLMLIGTGAGVEGKVKLGDVVCADRIFYFEYARLEIKKKYFGLKKSVIIRPRPQYENVKTEVLTALELNKEKKMQELFNRLIQDVNSDELPKEPNNEPELHKGTIAVGEKLMADGSLKKMYDDVDEKIRAGAMEDCGFAKVAESKGIQWCIFRGINDYGDTDKDEGNRDEWQLASALAASAAGISFLKSVWKY